jgi:hypothetical protein
LILSRNLKGHVVAVINRNQPRSPISVGENLGRMVFLEDMKESANGATEVMLAVGGNEWAL